MLIPILMDFVRMIELILAGIMAGILGALAGLGGGVVPTPVLTLFLGIPIIYATGSSLVSTISTSAGSASVYVRKRLANDRIGISLVTATTTGAIIGSLTANISSLYFAFEKKYEETVDYTIQLYRAQPENPGRVENLFINITSNLLKYGVFISIALMVLGIIMLFIHNGGMGIPLSKIIDPSGHADTSKITIMAVVTGVMRLDGLSLMLFGLMVLIAIPVAMVSLNLVRFVLEKDKLYTAMALITLINLLIAIFVLPMIILH